MEIIQRYKHKPEGKSKIEAKGWDFSTDPSSFYSKHVKLKD